MTQQKCNEQRELVRLIEDYSSTDGVHPTDIPSLHFIKRYNITDRRHSLYRPCFCIVLQGEKEVYLAQERFTYGPADYFVASLNVPVTSQVIKASYEKPYLAIKLDFDPGQVLEILSEMGRKSRKEKIEKRAIFTSKMEPSLLDAVCRLAGLVYRPQDIPVLAPIYTKEILYRILQGPHGEILEQIAIEGSHTYRISDVIQYIIKNYNRTLRIEELAEIAHMSASSLHRHFKEVTAMSPIQFQKQLRLQQARQLLLTKSTDAADVAFRVGYESPSQFSREYSRLFGLPPREDIKRLREKKYA